MLYFLKQSAGLVHVNGVGSCTELLTVLPSLPFLYSSDLGEVMTGAREYAATTGSAVCADCETAAQAVIQRKVREEAIEYAKKISEAIDEAEAAGFQVWIKNDCCGCGNTRLVLSEGDWFDTPHHVIVSNVMEDDG